jgi:hypothetical protein
LHPPSIYFVFELADAPQTEETDFPVKACKLKNLKAVPEDEDFSSSKSVDWVLDFSSSKTVVKRLNIINPSEKAGFALKIR